MKIHTILTSCTFFVLSINTAFSNDQNENRNLKDTIIFSPGENIKIIFIGNDMEKMVTYGRLDSLKSMLIEDVQMAGKQYGYPASPKTTHYFISNSGKRRLKTESQDFLEPEINVEREKQLLELNLPPCVFIIHDLAVGYDCYIYLKEPGQLQALLGINFSDALLSIAQNRQLLRQNFRIDLEKDEALWKVTNKNSNRQDLLEISPNFGAGLIGSQWSPTLGADISIQLTNKFSTPYLRIGAGISAYAFTPLTINELSSINLVRAYSFMVLGNLSVLEGEHLKVRWAGLEAGWLNTAGGNSLNGAYKLGFVSEGISVFNFSFDLIRTKGKKTIYGITLTCPF